MEEVLKIVSDLNSSYFDEYNDGYHQFYFEGNEFAFQIKFGDVTLYCSEEDSLWDYDSDTEIPLREYLSIKWNKYVELISSLNPFPNEEKTNN